MPELDLFAAKPTGQPSAGLDLFAPAPQPQPVGIQPVNIGNIAAQYQSGTMSPDKRPMFEELVRRGKVPGWAKAFQPGQDPGVSTLGGTQAVQPTGEVGRDMSPRQLAMLMEAESMGLGETFLTAVGSGLTTIGRGVGLAEPASEIEKEAMAALHQVSPIAAGAGEIIGEAAPFVPLAMATGGIGSLVGRAAGTGIVGAAEGGIIQAGKGEDAITGAGIGGAIGVGAEVILPVIGRLGRKVFQRVTGRAPKGALIDAAGQPTQELNEALQSAGMTFKDLTGDSIELIQKKGAAVDPEQLARREFLESQGLTGEAAPTQAQVSRGADEFQRQQEAAKTTGRARTRLENQEAVLTSRFNDAVTETTGKSSSRSSSVIDAVVDKATVLDQEISSLYKQAREVAPGSKNVKFKTLTSALKRAMPANRRSGGNVEAVLGEMQNIGILDKDMKVVGKVAVETAEELRKYMNELYDPQNGFGNDILRKLKETLDDDVFSASGDDIFNQARKAKRDFEVGLERAKISKFDRRKQNLVKDVLENKINPDEFVNQVVLSKKWRAKDLKQLTDYLSDIDTNALNDLKADVLETIKTKAFAGPEDANGFKSLSRAKLESIIDGIGENKLKVIFDDKERKFLDDMLKIAKMREPVRGTALGRGPSAQAIARLEKSIKDIPVLGFLVSMVDYDAAGRAVLKGRPQKLAVPLGRVEKALTAPVAAGGTIAALETQRGDE